jgi:chemotaxis protein MotA
MLPLIGILIVLGAIVGGYLMEHGNLMVLFQPAELVIIFGAAVGTIVVANPLSTLKAIVAGLKGVVTGGPYSRAFYLETLRMLYELYNYGRKAGTAKLEEDIDHPEKSQIFTKYPKFLKLRHGLHFLCDTMRTSLAGGVDAHDLDHMMEADLEVHHREAHEPVAALTTMADSLPGLGIVAAVLGVVITMGALGGPKEEIGHRVAAALVGTFLGILLCYGIFGPLASAMSKQTDAEGHYMGFLRMAALAYVKSLPPLIAVEMARRSIPTGVRPTFSEMETACRGGGASAAPQEKAA